MSVAVIGVGSNLGSREASIRAAFRLLGVHPELKLAGCSPLYETAPLGPEQPDYLNAAFRLETSLAPTEILALLLSTEKRLGRARSATERWGPRSLDLDLLWDERGAVETESLRVPHPQLVERAFALGPLLDVAPELEPLYGSALRSLGGRPPAWSRVAQLEPSTEDPTRVRSAEADALVDAATLALHRLDSAQEPHPVQPLATLHQRIAADADALAQSYSQLTAAGFAVDCVSVSDCSEAQWKIQFHGSASAQAQRTDVQLKLMPGSRRRYRAVVL